MKQCRSDSQFYCQINAAVAPACNLAIKLLIQVPAFLVPQLGQLVNVGALRDNVHHYRDYVLVEWKHLQIDVDCCPDFHPIVQKKTPTDDWAGGGLLCEEVEGPVLILTAALSANIQQEWYI